MSYNWQHPNWPIFQYNAKEIQTLILDFATEMGEVTGVVQSLSADLKQEAVLELMLSEALKTSQIEGEYLNKEDVMSSIRNNLGMNEQTVAVKNMQAVGVAQLMVEVRNSSQHPLSIIMIKKWHQLLMESAIGVTAGEWRKGVEPMQVVSGAFGKEIIHYEAPPSVIVPEQMDEFVRWFNTTDSFQVPNVAEAVLKSAIAHLYFESIHPFEDGNGRIGRAIAEKALSYFLDRPVMLSLSKAIEKNRKRYYAELKSAQHSLEITGWIRYFAGVILEAQMDAKWMAQFALKKAQFFGRYGSRINERQTKVINRMLANGSEGFQGGMTAGKYVSITGASKPTATRDLQHLLEIGAVIVFGGGRSVRYELDLDKN